MSTEDVTAEIAAALAEHFPNVVTEGAEDMCRTRVKCDGYGCDFYAEADGTESDWAGYDAATQAHRTHLADLLAARDRRVRAEALREAADAFGHMWQSDPLPSAGIVYRALRDRADRIEADA